MTKGSEILVDLNLKIIFDKQFFMVISYYVFANYRI
jgi:hypothetical protein